MRAAVFVVALVASISEVVGMTWTVMLVGGVRLFGDAETRPDLALATRIGLGFLMGIVTLLAGSAVWNGRPARMWGVVLIGASIVGALAAGALFVFGAVLGLVAGLMALFVRRRPVAETGA